MIGIDIESVSRFKKLFDHKGRLLRKMFNTSEWDYSINKASPSQTLAGIWCAKEAVVKAVYPIKQVFIKDITICHKSSGQPFAKIKNVNFKSESIKISISHTADCATAIAIFVNY